MIRSSLKLFPYHTFLLIPFIVVFLYAYNLGQTQPDMTYRSLWIGAGVTLAFFGVFYLLFRNRIKTGVYVSLLIFVLFQYGALYDFFESLYYKGMWPMKNIHRYLVVVYLLFIVISSWLIKRSKRDFVRLNYFLNIFILLLLAFNLIRINTAPSAESHLAAASAGNKQSIVFNKKDTLPDIYYIILDGYANGGVLEKYYGFKNDAFMNDLKTMDFRVCDSAFANYYYTSQSLGATLNLNYLKDSLSAHHVPQAEVQDNLLFKTLHDNHYKIYHLYSGFAITGVFANADSTITIDGPKEFEKSLMRYSVLRLDDVFGFFSHQRLTSQFKKMYEFSHLSTTPKFCFLHFVAPHPPYIFDRNGKIRTTHKFTEHSWEPKEFYVDQLIYVNRQITGLLKDIRKNDPNASIVLQSDHGSWISATDPDQVFEARSKILYAYYAPASVQIPDTTSPVNTFRYLFNGLFKCDLPLLPDKHAGKKALMEDPVLTKKIN